MSANASILLEDVGKNILLIFKNLEYYQKTKEDCFIEIEGLGEVSLMTLDLLFQYLWELIRNKKDEDIVIKFISDKQDFFLLQIRSNSLIHFIKIDEDKSFQYKENLCFDFNFFSEYAQKGMIPLLIDILKKTASNLSLFQFLKKICISPTGFDLILKWFLPTSGIGIILFKDNIAIPLIIYGGTRPKLKINKHETIEQHKLVKFSQEYRQKNHLASLLTFSIDKIIELVQKKAGLLETLSNYGKSWLISVPIEINDIILGIPEITKVLSIQNNFRYTDILPLLQTYMENISKFLSQNSIFLKLKDHNKNLLLEINKNGIFEITPEDKINEDNLFIFDVEMIMPIMSWLNTTSLQLITNFIDGIIPAEFSEKIYREEILINLKVLNEKNKLLDLFICGGEHSLPGKNWDGDYYLVLMSRITKKVLYSKVLLNSPLNIIKKNGQYKLHFPINCEIKNSSLVFKKINSDDFNLGIKKIISKSSILDEITPGIRYKMIIGSFENETTISFNKSTYKIIEGRLLWQRSYGRILKYHGMVKHASHTWLNDINATFITNAATSPYFKTPKSWEDFVFENEQGGIILKSQESKEIKAQQFKFLEWIDKYNMRAAGNVSVKLYILKAYGVPFDKKGNFLIRIWSIIIQKNCKYGLALLEIPCHISKLLNQKNPISITIKKQKQIMVFYTKNIKILSIHDAKYLNIHKSGLGWLFKH